MLSMKDYTPAEVAAMGTPDPDQTAILDAIGGFPKLSMDHLDAIRDAAQKRYAQLPIETNHGQPHCTESYVDVQVRDGFTNRGKVFKPSKPAAGGSPLAVLYFGGGFVLGECEQMSLYAHDLCRLFGATVFAPNYRLAPEHRFPVPFQDAWDAVVYANAHAAEWGADPARGFVVGGTSAGARQAAGVSLMAASDEAASAAIKITGVLLSAPALIGHLASVPAKYQPLFQSLEQNRDAPVLGNGVLDEMEARHQPDHSSPLHSRTLNRDGEMGRQPKTYMQVCGLDPLRDDAIVYDAMLREEGAATRLDVYLGMIHGFWTIFPQLPQGIKSRSDFVDGFGWLLGMEKREDEQAGKPWLALAQ